MVEGLNIHYSFAPHVDSAAEVGLVSFVVVYYRGMEDLRSCLRSIEAQDHRTAEVVLVDNGSLDGGVDAVLAEHTTMTPVRVVRRATNEGFASGANAGIAAARGEYLFLLNPDATVDVDCTSRLLGELQRGVDIAAPRILLRDDPRRLDNCGHGLYPDGLNWCRGRGQLGEGRFVRPEPLLLFSGAAVLMRRSALVATGGFDADYFGYGEDADLSLRAARLGLRCGYCPDAIVRHRVGGAFGATSFKKVFLVEKNRLRVAVTHLPASWLAVSPAWTVARHVAMALGAASGEGLAASWSTRDRWLLPFVVVAAHGASMADLPGSFVRRRQLRRWVRGRGGQEASSVGSSWMGRLRQARVGLREIRDRPRIADVPASASPP